MRSLRYKLSLGVAGITTLCLVTLFGWMYHRTRVALFDLLDQQARVLLQQVVLTRAWIADHGGLYLEARPGVASNPFLPGTDITDCASGRQYVFRNPAMVTRELSAYAERAAAYRFRLTSLRPRNPANTPTAFERRALERFQAQGFAASRDGMAAAGVEDGRRVYRRIIPLRTDASCLACHGQQGYREGDIRGGLVVILPMERTLAALTTARRLLVMTGTVLVAVMLLTLVFLLRRMVLQPLAHLHDVARRLQAGEYGCRASLHTGDEFQVLATAFNEMTSRIKRGYETTIKALVSAMDARDPYTRNHSSRVAAYAVAIGRQMGLEGERLAELELAAILHDVGKIGVQDRILRKPDRLVAGERDAMEVHPQQGVAILRGADFLADIIPCVLHHHERFDGGGYPSGLAGNALPLAARILAVADAFDAMTTDRPYRKAISREAAMAEIQRCAGSQFDPAVVAAFVAAVGGGGRKTGAAWTRQTT